MTSSNEVRKVFEVADGAYQAELVRVYGKRAGDMRYVPVQHTDAALIASRKARDEAQDAWHAHIQRDRGRAMECLQDGAAVWEV